MKYKSYKEIGKLFPFVYFLIFFLFLAHFLWYIWNGRDSYINSHIFNFHASEQKKSFIVRFAKKDKVLFYNQLATQHTHETQ